ncbi:BREX system P-loop protein BrxC [Singulisphaera rosea]
MKSLLNRDLFTRHPATTRLMNNGQARIADGMTEKELLTLREELSNFVCEGQYADGMRRVLESFLAHIGGTSQPAAWVSGFYGSGKSHLLKMLCHLWANTPFPDHGDTARTLVPDLPPDVSEALRELDTQGRRFGGLHAASGTLPAGGSDSVRLTVLGIVLRSVGLPTTYAQARFCLYLKNNGFWDQVRGSVEAAGKDYWRELNNLYVSPVLHDALIGVDSGYGDRKSVRETLKQEFKQPLDIDTSDFIRLVREVLANGHELPCTMLVLDEVQLYISDDSERATKVVEVAEALTKQLDCRLLLVGAGQSALGAQTAQFGKLRDRFTIPVELSDADVETVTRRVLLAKKPEHVASIRQELAIHDGEIKRQLKGTQLSSRSEDSEHLVEDYPILPVRRRFWEECFRAVDPAGTSGMLRTQLRIIHDALRELADLPLRTVVPADYIFEQLKPGLLQQGMLLKELDETIRRLDDGTADGKLARRLCGLIFLIRKLPREAGADKGIRSTPEMLADLMVSDLHHDGTFLRKEIPKILKHLEETGVLLKDHDEYNLQTKEYAEWDKEFRNRITRFTNQNETEIHNRREALIRDAAQAAVKGIKLSHGDSKVPRKLAIHFGADAPAATGHEIPVWFRDGWNSNQKSVIDSARSAGTDSPIVFVYVEKACADELKKQIIRAEGARGTIDFKGVPSTPEGEEARNAMQSRLADAERTRDELIQKIVEGAKVYKGGGTEQFELALADKVRSAADAALDRLFPYFKDADHKNWPVVISRGRGGYDAPLEVIDWTGPTEQHPVCKEILRTIGSEMEGKAIRKVFEESPYGWPVDTIDGALIALLATGHTTATHASAGAQSASQLDQGKITKTKFRVETVTLTAKDKIKLRGLFQEAGLTAKASDDLSAKSTELLELMVKLAGKAGGVAPLPECPKTSHILDLRAMAGNERLQAVLVEHDSLKEQAKSWREMAELSEKRVALWQRLQRFLKHAHGVDAYEESESAANGIQNHRLLLDRTDHVTPLIKKLAAALRTSVKTAHEGFLERHTEEKSRLEAADAWKGLNSVQRQSLTQQFGLDEIPAVSVGADDELLTTLDRIPLGSWRDKTDALSSRFAQALAAASKMLEPKIQTVRLTSGTLKTETEVRQWLSHQETALVAKLSDGPIVIQ